MVRTGRIVPTRLLLLHTIYYLYINTVDRPAYMSKGSCIYPRKTHQFGRQYKLPKQGLYSRSQRRSRNGQGSWPQSAVRRSGGFPSITSRVGSCRPVGGASKSRGSSPVTGSRPDSRGSTPPVNKQPWRWEYLSGLIENLSRFSLLLLC